MEAQMELQISMELEMEMEWPTPRLRCSRRHRLPEATINSLRKVYDILIYFKIVFY